MESYLQGRITDEDYSFYMKMNKFHANFCNSCNTADDFLSPPDELSASNLQKWRFLCAKIEYLKLKDWGVEIFKESDAFDL